MKSASVHLEELLSDAVALNPSQVVVRAIQNNPVLAVGYMPGSDLKLIFAMPPGSLNYELRTARLHGRANATVNGVFSDGNMRSLQTDILQFDSLTPAVRIVLDSLEQAIVSGNEEATSQLTADFVDLFSPGTSVSEAEITGLWGELILLDSFETPDKAIHNWHENLDSRYDFAVRDQRLEVKTTLGALRLHTFSSTQLPQRAGTTVTVASVLAEHTNDGETIVSLWGQIRARTLDVTARRKLDRLVLKLVKRDPVEIENTSFDIEYSRSSMKYYSAMAVPLMELPPDVLRATWDASLENTQSMDPASTPQLVYLMDTFSSDLP